MNRARLAHGLLRAALLLGLTQPLLGRASASTDEVPAWATPTRTAGAEAVARVEIGADRVELPADGRSLLRLRIRLLDAQGEPVRGRVAVSVAASAGRLVLPERLDALPRGEGLPGELLEAADGVVDVQWRAPDQAGEARLQVGAGTQAASLRVSFLPAARQMMGVGIVEGVLHLRHLSSGSLVGARPSDAFEQDIRSWQRSWDGGDATAAARMAFFLKGTIRGDALLTAAYDSDKDVRSRLFKDVKPDEYYPVYGDASVRGEDAWSTGRLYVRIDKDRSYLLLGDFTTTTSAPALQLGQYTRSATGLKAHHEDRDVLIDAFVIHDSLRRLVDELPGRGLSGPYFLSRTDGLVNSETVEILTRDRSQPAVVIKRVPLTRGVDYDFEPLSGRLLLRAPLPTLDESFNPLSLRVQYEVDQGGPRFWAGGTAVQVRPNADLELGGSLVEDRNPLARYSLASANVTLRLAERTVFSAEVARSSSEELITLGVLGQPSSATQPLGSADAERFELVHKGDVLDLRVAHARADTNFNNPAAPVAPGRRESSIKAQWKVDDRTRFSAEYLHTEDLLTGGSRLGGYVGLQTRLRPDLTWDVGLREVHETVTPAQAASVGTPTYSPDAGFFNPTGGLSLITSAATGSLTAGQVDQTSVRSRMAWSATDSLRLFGEVEQDLRTAAHRSAAVGADYRLTERARLYARHEFANSLSGAYGLNTGQRTHGTVFGVDAEYAKDASVFSEYRLREQGAGQELQRAVGLRNQWLVAPGLRLSTTAENVYLSTRTQAGDASAIAVGLDYTGDPDWKGSARLEGRRAPTADTWLSTVAVARRIDQDWTLLARNTYTRIDQQTAADQTRDRFQVGTAYRDTGTNRVNALMRYEYRYENDSNTPADDLRRRVHILSVHADRHASKDLTLTGQYAAKWLREDMTGVRSSFHAQLLAARVLYDLNDRIDLGLNLGVLTDRSWRNRQHAVGLELGAMLRENLWLSVGYNVQGLRDRDLVESDYLARGAYIRLRLKFDHRSWPFGTAGSGASAAP